MNKFQKAAAFYLLGILLLVWGVAIGRYGAFPSHYLDSIEDFVEGSDLGVETTVLEKLENDLGIEPTRFTRYYPDNAAAHTKPLDVPGLKGRRDPPSVYIAPGHREGYRVLFGAFDFEDAFWGGILLGPNGEMLHTWKLSSEAIGGFPDENKNMYGIHLTPDGSVIFSQQENARAIIKVDACSNISWYIPGFFHHTITATEDGKSFWTFVGQQIDFDHVLARYSVDGGQPELKINMADVRARNPYTHIFHLQREEDPQNKDISHGNDIDPLGEEMAKHFPQFEVGDLLISFRTQNLLFVLDPDTLKIKWWRVGAWDRQHDPDWEPNGTISVFSNNQIADRKYSDIVGIDPKTLQSRLIVDGEKLNLFSDINGDQSLTAFGTRIITSTTQGWTFEIDDDGEVVFSFVNTYEGAKHSSLNISEAQRLPEGYFTKEFWKQCEKS